jgi:tetratricopeptide (TPR) repeat protein
LADEKEMEAREQLRVARKYSGVRAAEAWIHLGEFIADRDLGQWSGLTPKECFRAALQRLPKGVHDALRADALLGYGTAQTEEGSGYRDPVLEEAIAHLSEAILIYEKRADKGGTLEARYYRAYAWTELVGPNRYSSSERALQELKSIRSSVRSGGDAVWAANVEFLIGTALLDRVEGDPRKNNDEAERAFKSGLRVFSRAKNQSGLAQGYLNLAVTYNQLQRLGDSSAGAKAIAYARRAWRHCTDEVPVELRTSILSNLANALAERGGRQWVANAYKAEVVLSQGIELGDAVDSPASHAMRLVRAGLVLGLVQYHGDDRMADVIEDLVACVGKFDATDTTQWWLEWMELRTLAAAVQDEPAEMIRLAEEALDQSDKILAHTKAFSEKSHLLSQLALIADLGVLGHLKTGGPVDGLLFARRVYGRMLGFDPELYEQPEGVAELYLLNPSTEDWTAVLLAAGNNCDLYPLEGIGKDFWSNAIEGLEEGFFSGLDDLRNYRGTNRVLK